MTTEKNWFDPNTYVEMMKENDFSKMFDAAKVPGVDTEAFTEAHKKNLQAVVDANRVASEGFQAVFKKQVELVQAGVTQASEMMKEANAQPMSAEGVEKRMEIAKAHFEKAMASFTELTESARKANEDAFAILQARATEGMEEMKDLSAKSMEAMKVAA